MKPGKFQNGNDCRMLGRKSSQDLREPEIVDVAPEECLHMLGYLNVIRKRCWVVLLCLILVILKIGNGTRKVRIPGESGRGYETIPISVTK